MTILTIMRHAKSDWGDSRRDDFDRPLNDRGRKAAKRVGAELESRRIRFDLVLASPAVRVRETLEEVEVGYGQKLDIQFDKGIYGAGAPFLLERIRDIQAAVHSPLLVGHNPGLQELVLQLTRADDRELRQRVQTKFPTAAVAVIEMPAVRWDEVEPGTGKIVELILPRELGG